MSLKKIQEKVKEIKQSGAAVLNNIRDNPSLGKLSEDINKFVSPLNRALHPELQPTAPVTIGFPEEGQDRLLRDQRELIVLEAIEPDGPNEGKITAYKMYVNPEQASFAYAKLLAEQVTRDGYFWTHWGNRPIKLKFSGTTGWSGVKGVKILERFFNISGQKINDISEDLGFPNEEDYMKVMGIMLADNLSADDATKIVASVSRDEQITDQAEQENKSALRRFADSLKQTKETLQDVTQLVHKFKTLSTSDKVETIKEFLEGLDRGNYDQSVATAGARSSTDKFFQMLVVRTYADPKEKDNETFVKNNIQTASLPLDFDLSNNNLMWAITDVQMYVNNKKVDWTEVKLNGISIGVNNVIKSSDLLKESNFNLYVDFGLQHNVKQTQALIDIIYRVGQEEANSGTNASSDGERTASLMQNLVHAGLQGIKNYQAGQEIIGVYESFRKGMKKGVHNIGDVAAKIGTFADLADGISTLLDKYVKKPKEKREVASVQEAEKVISVMRRDNDYRKQNEEILKTRMIQRNDGVNRIALFWGKYVFVGHFDDFSWSRNARNNVLVNYNASFTIEYMFDTEIGRLEGDTSSVNTPTENANDSKATVTFSIEVRMLKLEIKNEWKTDSLRIFLNKFGEVINYWYDPDGKSFVDRVFDPPIDAVISRSQARNTTGLWSYRLKAFLRKLDETDVQPLIVNGQAEVDESAENVVFTTNDTFEITKTDIRNGETLVLNIFGSLYVGSIVNGVRSMTKYKFNQLSALHSDSTSGATVINTIANTVKYLQEGFGGSQVGSSLAGAYFVSQQKNVSVSELALNKAITMFNGLTKMFIYTPQVGFRFEKDSQGVKSVIPMIKGYNSTPYQFTYRSDMGNKVKIIVYLIPGEPG